MLVVVLTVQPLVIGIFEPLRVILGGLFALPFSKYVLGNFLASIVPTLSAVGNSIKVALGVPRALFPNHSGYTLGCLVAYTGYLVNGRLFLVTKSGYVSVAVCIDNALISVAVAEPKLEFYVVCVRSVSVATKSSPSGPASFWFCFCARARPGPGPGPGLGPASESTTASARFRQSRFSRQPRSGSFALCFTRRHGCIIINQHIIFGEVESVSIPK